MENFQFKKYFSEIFIRRNVEWKKPLFLSNFEFFFFGVKIFFYFQFFNSFFFFDYEM